jgi:hypothetical protein
LGEVRNPFPHAPLSQYHRRVCWVARRLEERAMTLVARFLFYVFVVIFLILLILGLTIFRV